MRAAHEDTQDCGPETTLLRLWHSQKNGTPLKDAVLGDVDDVPNLLQKGAFTLLTVHLVFLGHARWHIHKTESETNLLADFQASVTPV